ncbi:MAG: asparagine--tRNA ligase [Parachlamydiales bacterium]|jgi:asparaginyl-tRNA synthetase
MRTKLKNLLHQPQEKVIGQDYTVAGWIKTVRAQKELVFIEINDGSSFSNLQIIADKTTKNFTAVAALTTGSSIQAQGHLLASPAKGQKVELKATEIFLFGPCPPESYPLQKKGHSFEFLRTIAHLRPRTNMQGAVTRVRNALSFAIHRFFQQRDFYYIQTPIITSSDCEGAGELFRITTLDLEKPPKTKDGKIDFKEDFFGSSAFLTVSGQLNLECFALALGDVYTFGPTFRAENSNTSRHLAEFWMIEPEMVFADLDDDIETAKAFLKFILQEVLSRCPEDLAFFEKFIEKGLVERLQKVVDSPFEEISYTEALKILEKAGQKFEFPVKWGIDLQSEHERYLAEKHFQKPIVIRDYPETIKAFYMRRNADNKTVAAMDVIVPKIGEIIGGSQREDRLEVLEEKLLRQKLSREDYSWYLDLRRFGSVPHAGFGLGFERLVCFVTGVENIRDVIPFPRYPKHISF